MVGIDFKINLEIEQFSEKIKHINGKIFTTQPHVTNHNSNPEDTHYLSTNR